MIHRWHLLLLFIGMSSLFFKEAQAGDLTFEDISSSQGIGSYQMAPGMGGGIAAADYDGDGDVDFFVPTAEGTPHLLYRNLTVEGGSQRFEEIAVTVGIGLEERGRSALWIDANGDGLLDLIVASDCFQSDCTPGTTMLRHFRQNASGHFDDVTQSSGLFDDAEQHRHWRHRGGLSAGDIDLDGDPDLFSTIWLGGVQLYENTGDGSFINRSGTLGQISLPRSGVGPWQAVFHDFNQDGLQDIFVAVDFAENYLLLQRADGGFTDVALASGATRPWNGMGIALGDTGNDGGLDIYVTNITDIFDGVPRHSTFYHRQPSGAIPQFVESSQQAGVDDAGWGWGVTYMDADNDGWLDLAVTNGFVTHVDTSRFFFNSGAAQPSFQNNSSDVNFNDMDWGSSLVSADLDRDGDLDLLQTCSDGPLRVLANQQKLTENHYLVVKPRRIGRFEIPLGALVQVEVGNTTMTRLITAGTSFMGQEPAEAFFGLGPATTVDRVTVIWPRGGRTVVEQVPADQILTITDAKRCYNSQDFTKRWTGWPREHNVTRLVEILALGCPETGKTF